MTDFINAGANLLGEAVEDGIEAAGSIWNTVTDVWDDITDCWNDTFY